MVSASKRGFNLSLSNSATRRRMVLVPISMEASLLREVGSDFTTEFLREDVGCQFGLKDLERGPIIKVVRLDGSSGDDSDEKLVRGLTGDGVDREIEAVEILLIIIF
jgi:hypothetical protein